jgi:hypothetical protein
MVKRSIGPGSTTETGDFVVEPRCELLLSMLRQA